MAKSSKRFLKLHLVIAAVLSRCVSSLYEMTHSPSYIKLSCGESGCYADHEVGISRCDMPESMRIVSSKLTFAHRHLYISNKLWVDAAQPCYDADECVSGYWTWENCY